MPEAADELLATRTTLIKRLKDWQDQASWQDFFDTYWKLIYGVSRKSGLSDAEAQEVVQETMISVSKHMPNFQYDRSIGSFRAWLLNMTRWRIADQIRKRKYLCSVVLSSETTIGTSTIDKIVDPASHQLELVWEIEWEKNLVETAVSKVKRQVDPQKYQIFDFYVNKGWKPEDVASTFNVPVGQVYLAKHRVADLIKKEVEKLKMQLC